VPVLLNSLEGVTPSGTTISNANSGGVSGNALDTVSIGAGSVLASDSAHAAHGGLSLQCSSAAATFSFGYWGTSLGAGQPQVWFRIYLYVTAQPAANNRVVTFWNTTSAGTLCGAVLTNTAQKIIMQNSGSTTILTSANTYPLNQWFRVEGFLLASATVGQLEFKLFNGLDDPSVLETQTSTALQNTGASVGSIGWGISNSPASAVGPLWLDDFGASTTGYLGPASVAAPDMPPLLPLAPGWHPGQGLPGMPGGTPFYAPPSGDIPAGGVIIDSTGAAAAGAGAVAAAATQAAGASLTAAGTVTAVATQIAGAPLTGAAAVTATATQAATASLAGAGSVTAVATQIAAAAPAAAGTVTAVATQSATATLAGAGVVTAAGTVSGLSSGTAAVAGAGAVTALATQAAVAAPAGAGTVTAAATQAAGAALAGAGAVTAKAAQAAGGTLTGAGALAAVAAQAVTASLAGVGSLTAAGSAGGGTATGTASLAGAGAVSAVVTQRAGAVLTAAGAVTATGQGTPPIVNAASTATVTAGSTSAPAVAPMAVLTPAVTGAAHGAAVTDPRDGTSSVTPAASSTPSASDG
jgi:hypothetical protein